MHWRSLIIPIYTYCIITPLLIKCEPITGEVRTNSSHSRNILLSDSPSRDLTVNFNLIFPNYNISYPIMNIRASVDRNLLPPRTCFYQEGSLIPNKHYILLNSTYVKACMRSGEMLKCSGSQSYSYLNLRYWFVSFAYSCLSGKRGMFFHYNFTVSTEVNSECKEPTLPNKICKDVKNWTGSAVYSPNLFGLTQQETYSNERAFQAYIKPKNATSVNNREKCYQYIDLFFCTSLYPSCTVNNDSGATTVGQSKYHFVVPCRRMCEELFQGCQDKLGGTVECEHYPDGMHNETECFYMEVQCPRLDDTFMNGSLFVTGNKINDTATYKCHNGLVLDGPGHLTCLPSGEWDHTPPACRIKPKDSTHLSIIIGVSLTAVMVITTVLIIIFCRERIRSHCFRNVRVAPQGLPLDGKPPKIFISFASENQAETDEFMNGLRNNIPRCIYFNYHEHFHAGSHVTEAMHEAVATSMGMITFLTQDFVNSDYCYYEFKEGYHKSKRDKSYLFIVVLTVENIDQLQNDREEIKTCLSQDIYLYIKVPDFWSKLDRALTWNI